MLNVAAVPILTITLRNNLMQVLPIKKWLRNYDCSFARFLLEVRRALNCLGQQKNGQRSVVLYCFDTSNHYCVFHEEPPSHSDLYRRHLRNIYLAYHPDHLSSLFQKQVG